MQEESDNRKRGILYVQEKRETEKGKESPYRESRYTQEVRDCLMGSAYCKREFWGI